ncbi:MAG: S41 family peptidase [Patescibacteria group bacterium]
MKAFATISRLIVIPVLILIAGSLLQYRYNVTQFYPDFLLPETQQGSGDVSPGTVARLLNYRSQPDSYSTIDFDVFWQAWELIERTYVDPSQLDAEIMVDGAIAGMAAAAGDPYTAYLPPEDKERSAQDLAGSFYGVGIELGYVDGVLAVVAPLDGTPAAQAGVQAGDLILRVQDPAKDLDEQTTNWSLSYAVDKIRGPRNSEVVLTLFRDTNGQEPFEVPIVRDEIVVESVVVNFEEHADTRVAHVKLSRFGDRTEGEWDAAVAEILSERNNIDGIVLDMRNNPGGYFDGAIDVASDFIANGVVVSQAGRDSNQDFRSTGQARLQAIPHSILVNGGSASASEIVAGAMRDQLGSQLVGTKTFGKGSVQDRRELPNGGAMHITIAKWIMPSGVSIEEGITVDEEVENDPETEEDEQLLRAIELIQ